jgi:hypothetical protein
VSPRYWFSDRRHRLVHAVPSLGKAGRLSLGFLGFAVAGFVMMPPGHSLAGFVYIVTLSALFAGLCWWKGELS